MHRVRRNCHLSAWFTLHTGRSSPRTVALLRLCPPLYPQRSSPRPGPPPPTWLLTWGRATNQTAPLHSSDPLLPFALPKSSRSDSASSDQPPPYPFLSSSLLPVLSVRIAVMAEFDSTIGYVSRCARLDRATDGEGSRADLPCSLPPFMDLAPSSSAREPILAHTPPSACSDSPLTHMSRACTELTQP